MDILERDVHAERRRIFWQRAYLEALRAFLQDRPRELELCTDKAATTAERAVKDLDEWEAKQGSGQAAGEAKAPTAGAHPGNEEDDDQDVGYLGR